jgi:hypothetical protein
VISSRTPVVRRLPVLAGLALVGLVAPVSIGVTAPAGSAAPAAPAAQLGAPAQRYVTALVNKKEVRKGKKVTITGRVDAPEAPACAAGVTLTIERSTKGAIYKAIDTVTTDAGGAYKVKEVVKKKSRFRVSAPLTDACTSAQSPPRTVDIKD